MKDSDATSVIYNLRRIRGSLDGIGLVLIVMTVIQFFG